MSQPKDEEKNISTVQAEVKLFRIKFIILILNESLNNSLCWKPMIFEFYSFVHFADKFGQRAYVGKVCMDINNAVPEYKETTDDSVKDTER